MALWLYPKHLFYCWQSMLGRMSLKGFLQGQTIPCDTSFVLCSLPMGSTNDLFLQCPPEAWILDNFLRKFSTQLMMVTL